VHTVEYLLSTASTGSKPSLNISFLGKLFGSHLNTDTLLCRSSLYNWAREESWGQSSVTREKGDHTSRITEGTQSNKSLMNKDAKEEATLDHLWKSELGDLTDVHPYLNRRSAESDKSWRPSQSSLRQLSAKLHCLHGVSTDSVRKDAESTSRYSLRSDTVPVHPYARSLVYDLRQHTDHTFWGPFLGDGSYSVDWEKVEALMVILDHNLELSADTYHGMPDFLKRPFAGASPKSYISQPSTIPIEPSLPLESQDPYNITGTWMRVVCFLDYTELYDFNFGGERLPDDQPRRALDTDEATRFITMKIRVTKIERPGEEDGQRLPVVHFKGSGSSFNPSIDPNANSMTKGCIRFQLSYSSG